MALHSVRHNITLFADTAAAAFAAAVTDWHLKYRSDFTMTFRTIVILLSLKLF